MLFDPRHKGPDQPSQYCDLQLITEKREARKPSLQDAGNPSTMVGSMFGWTVGGLDRGRRTYADIWKHQQRVGKNIRDADGFSVGEYWRGGISAFGSNAAVCYGANGTIVYGSGTFGVNVGCFLNRENEHQQNAEQGQCPDDSVPDSSEKAQTATPREQF